MDSPTLTHRNAFHQQMLIASALSWVLVALMPVINAHGASAGVWSRLCTINGFEYVQVEQASPATQHSKPCPFAYFAALPEFNTAPTLYFKRSNIAGDTEYAFLALSTRFEPAIPRAPPSFSTAHQIMLI
ncbi:hypothetical protein JCM19238_117 [Vibrio ponticus]|uniref:hypothetical protein n=1 Tax=Vibrio rhodolitus TaxID=2231649 RepID=UPI000500B353|nr:hypothetical protein [Vibrio rhodolitus]GAK82574.1 hypothetical protein JCM19238_117 [Vibrio ponticus]